MFNTIDTALGRLCTAVTCVAFVFMAAIAFVDSIGRMLNHPLNGTDEYVELALLLFFFAALPLVTREDDHIRVGLFAELYKPRLARIERLFSALVEVLALSVFVWMIWDQADRLARFATQTIHLHIPLAPFVYVAAAMGVASVWFALGNLYRHHAAVQPRPHAIPDED